MCLLYLFIFLINFFLFFYFFFRFPFSPGLFYREQSAVRQLV